MKFSLFLWIVCFYCIILSCSSVPMFVISPVNPDCPPSLCKQHPNTQLVYVRSTNSTHSLHLLLSVGEYIGSLSLTYSLSTFVDEKVVIKWPMIFSSNSTLRKNAVAFTQPNAVLFSSVLTFFNFVEYNDDVDKADISQIMQKNSSYLIYRSLSDFNWNVTVDKSNDPDRVIFATNKYGDKNDSLFKNGGSLSIIFYLSPDYLRNTIIPRLILTGNNTQFDWVLDNLNTTFASSRFALQTSMLTSEKTSTQKLESDENMDDEYTPGIFRLKNWLGSSSLSAESYVQWKEVCYLENERHLLKSTTVKQTDLQSLNQNDTAAIFNYSLPLLLFNSLNFPHTSLRGMNISFGQEADKFYVSSLYTVWSGSFGIGNPPSDSVSVLVVMVILAGLGIPILLIIAGGAAVCVWKRRHSNPVSTSGYSTIET